MRTRVYVFSGAFLIVCASLVFGVTLLSQSGTPDLTKLDRALETAGYRRYNPPRTNWGPGFVFAGDVVDHRIANVQAICPDLYANSGEPQTAEIVLSDYAAKDNFSFGLAVNFLKEQLKGGFDLGTIEREGSVDIQWVNIREMSYSHMDKWLETGEPRPIAKPCRLAIDDIKSKNRFKDRIFVIVRAVAPEKLVYDFSRAAKMQAGASGEFLNTLKGSAQGQAQMTDSTRLQITRRMYIGYASPLKLEDWTPTNLLSGEIVGVRASKSNLIIE